MINSPLCTHTVVMYMVSINGDKGITTKKEELAHFVFL